MNQYNTLGAPGKQPDNNQNAKSHMPFNPSNLGGLPNSSFPTGLPNLTPGALATTFGSAGMPGDHMTYPYMQDMAYQEHMKKLREKFGEMREQIDKMEKNPDLFKTHQLPLARVKKIMKSDEDVRMISAEAPVLFAKACEIFIIELTHRAWFHTEEGKRRTLQKNDIAQCIANTDIFDFLIDIIPREEYTKNALLKKPADSYLNFGQYGNPSAVLGNIPIPPNLNYQLPSSMSSMGVNLNPSLLSNIFPPNPKGGAQNPLLNSNLLNYQSMMNSGQYGLPNFDLGGAGGMPPSGPGSKGNPMSKKEADNL